MVIKWKAYLPLKPGTNLMCNTKCVTMIEMNAQVSFGSQLQYLPQDSFAQIPLRNSQQLMQNKPMVGTFLKRWLIL